MSIPKDDGEPSGTLRLGLPQVVADVALFDIAAGLKAAFSALDLRCRTEWSSGLQLQVAGGELDAAAVMVPSGSAQPAGTRGSFIATLDMLVVQSRHAPNATKAVTIADLPGPRRTCTFERHRISGPRPASAACAPGCGR